MNPKYKEKVKKMKAEGQKLPSAVTNYSDVVFNGGSIVQPVGRLNGGPSITDPKAVHTARVGSDCVA